jgi:deoxyadenosine/deoxycytidine kinase
MLKNQGFLNDIEWQLYNAWFDTFATDLPMAGIVHITTPSEIAYERIQKRARDGEAAIELSYLIDLAAQHSKWLSQTPLPVLRISTEAGVDIRETLTKLGEFLADK